MVFPPLHFSSHSPLSVTLSFQALPTLHLNSVTLSPSTLPLYSVSPLSISAPILPYLSLSHFKLSQVSISPSKTQTQSPSLVVSLYLISHSPLPLSPPHFKLLPTFPSQCCPPCPLLPFPASSFTCRLPSVCSASRDVPSSFTTHIRIHSTPSLRHLSTRSHTPLLPPQTRLPPFPAALLTPRQLSPVLYSLVSASRPLSRLRLAII